jgi:hypothetical protein
MHNTWRGVRFIYSGKQSHSRAIPNLMQRQLICPRRLERHLRLLSAVFEWGVGSLVYGFSLIDTRGTKEEALSNAWPVGSQKDEKCYFIAIHYDISISLLQK